MKSTALKHNWKKSKLGAYFQIKHGYAFKGEFFANAGPYILLTPGNFKAEGGITLKGEKEKYYIGDFPKEFILKRNDFLIVLTDLIQNAPILGSPAFILEDGKFLHNQRLGKVVNLNTKEMDILFLYYILNSKNVRDQIRGSATGSTVRHTAPERIYAVDVEIPPLPTQHKIAAILSAYDDLIENNTRRIAILEEMAQALYCEWFVHFRFPGHENMAMVESALGMIPEGWEVVKLGDVCFVTMGQSPSSEFYNSNGDGLPFHQGVTNFGSRYPVDRMYCTAEGRVAQAGDILFSVRAPVGRLNIADKKIIIGRGVSAIRSKSGNQTFVFQQLKEQFQEEDSIGNGAIFKAVTKEDVHGIKLIYPSQGILSAFEAYISPVFSKLENLIKKNAILRHTRDLLLPKLISGELDVEGLAVALGGDGVGDDEGAGVREEEGVMS